MAKTSNPVPPGMHTVTPHIIVRDAVKAIEFYKKAFGAKERFVLPGPDGRTMHAEIQIGDSVVMLADESPQMGALSPESRGGATSVLMMYSDDVDKLFEQAVKAGGTVRLPLHDAFWGDRYGQVTDPFGHHWALATHIEDVSPEDLQKRSEEACKQMAASKK
jgi:uncharacterized glyoxalase superfamily protein PhnB